MLLTATFMAQFEFSVVNVAAPSIRLDLQTSESALELVVGGYAFAYAAALVLGGRLGDLFGHRRLFVLGMLGFTVTSALCGVAANSGQLVAARIAHGLSAALMLPQVLAVITVSSDPTERPRAIAWYGVAAGLGGIVGQVFGGLLVTADVAGLGWRPIFLVTVPIGLLGAALARRVLPDRTRTSSARRSSVDPLGALGGAFGLALMVVPLMMGRTSGWPWWTWALMVAAVPVLAMTLVWQHILRQRGGHPLLELALFRAPSFRSGLISAFAFMASFASYMFTLALVLQAGLGLNAFQTGLTFTAAGVGYSVTAMSARPLVRRYGDLAIAAGATVSATGLVGLGAIVVAGGADTPVAGIVLATAVISIGNGVVLPSLIGGALRDVPAEHAGAGAGALTTAQQFGGAVGVAGIGTLYFATAGKDQGIGMAWAAGADAVLMLVVAALALAGARRGRRELINDTKPALADTTAT